MIRITISPAAFEAIARSLPLGNVAYETERNAEAAWVRMPIYNPAVVAVSNRRVKGPTTEGNASVACCS
jgi:hypothetical protein